jgi:CIC family chloride channel protein
MATGDGRSLRRLGARTLRWRPSGTPRTLLLAALIGVGAGLVAVAFGWFTDFCRETFLEGPLHIAGEAVPVGTPHAWWILVIPALGGLVVGTVVSRFALEAQGHGTEQMIYSFHRLAGRVRRRVIGLKALCSAVTVGTGGSGGQVGPAVQIGAGVGSALSDLCGLGDRDRRTFLLAGASAGIGALFSAPLAGALFAPEVLYRQSEFEGEAIVPCIIASIVGYTVFTGLTGDVRAIEIDPQLLAGLSFGGARELPLYLVLALVLTALSWIWVRTFQSARAAFRRLDRIPLPLRTAFGGLAVGALALSIAPLTGEHGVLFGGYELMRGSVAGEISLRAAALLVLAKIVATCLTIGSGGSGGLFAPSLAIGALAGSVVGGLGARWWPGLELEPAAFALVGMGAFFAGVSKTPVAAILLVSEMTGHYALLAPLMLVGVLHLVLSHGWTLYETQVERQIDSPAHAGEYVKDVLEDLRVEQVVDRTRPPTLVHQDVTLRAALDLVASSTASYFPVVDDAQQLVGIFSLSDIRRIFLEVGVDDLVLVRDFMVEEVTTIELEATLDVAQNQMNRQSVAELPVVDAAAPRRVVAMLSRNQLGAAYHRRLGELRQGRG